jgi:serine/threonine protein kinase
MADVLKKFGRYFLLDQIAQGGMAEIYRARLADQEGAGRLLVIKRIQATYGSNNEFLQMFKSEIKVTMGFNHPNIVQLYDFGEEQDQPYIAMEFVDGRNLRQFLSRVAEQKQQFPVELAAYVMEQAASGLHYAHAYKDKISGQALNIVHRDISPQNILVSYEGNVKIIDFGIAKATTNSESTRAGVIKGKPSYLSPEQISGDPLDGRCDIFALGIVFWEVLTGRKLFAGDNDLAVLKLIESCNSHVKPPSTVNPKVPKELDYIVLRCLAKQQEKRYQTGEELQRAIHKFLYGFSPDFNPSDLTYFAKDLFKNEIVDDRKKLQKLSEKAGQLLVEEGPDLGSSFRPIETVEAEQQEGVKREDTTTIVEARGRGGKFAKVFDAGKERVEIEVNPAAVTPRSRMTSTGTKNPTITGSGRTSSARSRAPHQRVSGGGVFAGLFKLFLVALLAFTAVVIVGPDFGIRIPVVTDMVEDLLGGNASLMLTGHMNNVSVVVNGKKVGDTIPTVVKRLPVGSPIKVEVIGPSVAFRREITIGKGEKKELAVTEVQAIPAVSPRPIENAKIVLLRLNVTPGGGGYTVTLNGKSIKPDSPVTVPLDAPLELVADRPGFKTLGESLCLIQLS